MSGIDIDDLDRLAAEADELKNYRANGTKYSEKCAELIERIKCVFGSLNFEKLTPNQLKYLKSIKKTLAAEEQFAKSSFETRSVEAWKEFLND